MVSEIVKPRANKGEGGGLSFYRDQNGAESDLVVEGSAGFTLVEAKSTKTASASLFDDSKRIRRHLARSAGPCPVAVVYGGDQPQRRGADTLIPWRELHRLDWDAVRELRDWLMPPRHPRHLLRRLNGTQLCRDFPEDAVDFLSQVTDDTPLLGGDLKECLKEIRSTMPHLKDDQRFLRLVERLRISGGELD